jgi:F-type H+-transporting ATPase subunit delta
VISAEEQGNAIAAIADKAGISGLAGNFVRLLARNRRLFTLPDVIRAFKAMAAEARGEVTADVVAARALSDEQTAALKDALKAALGKDVAISASVDPAILGGLIVRVGSRMIDSSLRTKLNIMTTRLKRAS